VTLFPEGRPSSNSWSEKPGAGQRLYRALSLAHQQVQAKIETEERSLAPDWFRINELKRRKLSIKDRMRSVLEHGRDAFPLRSPAGGVRRPSHGMPLSSDA